MAMVSMLDVWTATYPHDLNSMRLSVRAVVFTAPPPALGSFGPELRLSIIPDQVRNSGVGSGPGASGVIGLWCGSSTPATNSATGITGLGEMFASYAYTTSGASMIGELEWLANASIPRRSGEMNGSVFGNGRFGAPESDSDSSFSSSRLLLAIFFMT